MNGAVLAAALATLLAASASAGAPSDPAIAEPVASAATGDTSDGGLVASDDATSADVEQADDLEGPDDAELEAERTAPGAADAGYQWTAELSDEELAARWVDDLPSLGSISVGFAEAGRLINGVQLEPGDSWTVVAPEAAWGTQETIDALKVAATAVREELPDAPPLRVNHLSKREGGYLRPHHSHQAGRDADLGFFYRAGVSPHALKVRREDALDPAANWALLRALVTRSDVQLILVDRRVQKVLIDYALAHGEDPAWIERLFHAGRDSLIHHARRHRDHFHVRFYAGRSQELGYRVQPLLAKRPDENILVHRVGKGDTLGRIAQRYGSTVALIQRANGLKGSMLSIGRTLAVPLRGPCTQCPRAPLVQVPPRPLPPEPEVTSVDGARTPGQLEATAPSGPSATAQP